MAAVTLRDLYAAELHDLMNAEQQIVAELPTMASRATSGQLQRVLEEHHAETEVQIERLRLLLEHLNEPPRAVPGGAVAALLEDARRRLDDTERGEVLDAALVTAVQRIEHYEMASYGTVRSYAEALGDYDAVRILQQTLDEEGHADHALTRLAERGINQAAGDDLLEQSTRYRSRLRFVGTKDLPDARDRDVHLHNRAGEHLGTLDGFIVESQSGRPIYYVIDSRGWFAGRRYVVPVGQIEGDHAGPSLRTTLTRAELARYPEFSPSAFTAMDDHDAIRYERRLHRVFAPDSKPYDGRPVYEDLPAYKTPAWPAAGVGVSDSSDAPMSPGRPSPDRAAVRPPDPTLPATGSERTAEPEGEVMTGQGAPEPPTPCGEEPRKRSEPPRSEQYRER